MKAIILIVSSLRKGFVTAPAWGAVYERNTARPVEQVVFGQVDAVQHHPAPDGGIRAFRLENSGRAVLGGLLGNQFGSGHGRELPLRSGRWQERRRCSSFSRGQRGGEQAGGAADPQRAEQAHQRDPGLRSAMVFAQGDKVRILYFNDGVRVDKTY